VIAAQRRRRLSGRLGGVCVYIYGNVKVVIVLPNLVSPLRVHEWKKHHQVSPAITQASVPGPAGEFLPDIYRTTVPVTAAIYALYIRAVFHDAL